MALKTRRWRRAENDGLSFTELGCGTAPLGNLYRANGELFELLQHFDRHLFVGPVAVSDAVSPA